jgi:dipeptidyl-peptidase III
MRCTISILIFSFYFSFATSRTSVKATEGMDNSFKYVVDQFADIQILRYQVPGFESLTLKQKELIYYLNEAALQGRDILYDQNYKYNLCIRRTLESVYQYANIDKNSKDWKEMELYLKRIWVSNGIHHHYATDKFIPGFTKDFFSKAVLSVNPDSLPLIKGESAQSLIELLIPILFDSKIATKRVNQDSGQDLLLTSAENYYQDVSQKEAEYFYDSLKDSNDLAPVSYGLNSRLVKENGIITEKIWKADGLYGQAITKIIYWLEKAAAVTENQRQSEVINKLIEYYRTGNLKTFDQYSILWVEDINSKIDFINGFIETYGDPLGLKASWESTVNVKDEIATKRTETISKNAQWFEDHSPVAPEFKKEKVKGVTAKVINVTILAGDCYPTTPIGINLPNSDWIRRDYGSKSVTIDNITEAYDKASSRSGFNEEFMWSKVEIDRNNKYGYLVDNLHTDLHECLGHGSGKMLAGVNPDTLKAYGATIEEARADLFGLYYLADPKLTELALTPNDDAYKAEYYKYMMNGLMTQLTRINPGNRIEESHMRNRALIAHWVFEKGATRNVVEMKKRGNKTFVVINDYEALRTLFGKLLAEIQRIKSTGDFKAAQQLVETYGVKVDPQLHQEILKRYKSLNLAPYKGFVNPVYKLVYDTDGKIADVKISYTEGYAEQHLRYSREYSNLPRFN